MTIDGNSLQTLTEDFRAQALALGISGETVGRMANSPERALACVQESVRRNAGPGLAVHMFDAGDWPSEPKATGTNRASLTECSTCGGDRFVVYSQRPPIESSWMTERGFKASEHLTDEMAPCPDCNSADASFWRSDGTLAKPPDPENVRRAIQ